MKRVMNVEDLTDEELMKALRQLNAEKYGGNHGRAL